MIKYLVLIIAVFLTPSVTLADINTANQALKSGDYVRAAEEFKKLAEQGNAKAQSHLGYLYYVGEGVQQNYEEAVIWYGKAAVQGDRDAQYNYAVAYAFGEGIKQDYKEAAIWYRRAAEQGHAIAQYSLGISYTYGEGVPQDEKLAAEWFMKSAEAGYENAQAMVGSLYHTGDGLPKDYAKAVEWYRKAASQGNAVAQYNLGSIYRAGKGVQKNTDEALKWYRLAADQNYEAAKTEVESLERSIAGATKEKTAPPPAPPVEKEHPVAVTETITTPIEKKIEPTASQEIVAAPVAQTITKNEPAVVATETGSAPADPEQSGDGFFGTLKNLLKTDKPEATSQPVQATVPDKAEPAKLTAKPEPTPEPEPLVDDVQVEKTRPEITVVPEPALTAAIPEANRETTSETQIKIPEPPTPPASTLAEETKEPLFTTGKTVTSITDIARPQVAASPSISADIKTQQTARVGPAKKETIADPVPEPAEQVTEVIVSKPVIKEIVEEKPAAISYAEDTAPASEPLTTQVEKTPDEQPGRLSSYFSKLFGSEEEEIATVLPSAETASAASVADEPEQKTVAATTVPEPESLPTPDWNEQLTESADQPATMAQDDSARAEALRGMEELQIAKAEIPEQTVPLETIARQQLETVPADSIDGLISRAVSGNPDAQLELGDSYYQGNRVGRDLAQAFLWYRRAALQNKIEAQYNLGNMYRMGEGTAQNDLEARNWYERAARQGHETARQNLEKLQHVVAEKPADNEVERSAEQSITTTTETEDDKDSVFGFVAGLFKSDDDEEDTAAATGNTQVAVSTPEPAKPEPAAITIPGQSDYERGLAYAYGEGVPQNYNNAFKLFESAAMLGHASAQYQLALAYANGHGVTKNPPAAVEWYEKAARQGLHIAQRSLGNVYLNGDGVQPNRPLAFAWYSLLAEQGNVLDIHRRDSLREQLTDAEIQESESLKKQLSASLSTASTTF